MNRLIRFEQLPANDKIGMKLVARSISRALQDTKGFIMEKVGCCIPEYGGNQHG